MSANGSNRFLNIEDANLRVRSGNVHAKGITVGGITVGASHGLQRVSDVSNTTSNTLQFTNATTSFKATSNIEVGGDVSYTSKPKISVESNVVTEYTGPHDRPLRKYPEVALLSGQSGLSGGYTQDGYTVKVSNESSPSLASYAFNGKYGDNDVTGAFWYTGNLNTYNGTPTGGYYVGSVNLGSDGGRTATVSGDWIELELPNKIKLEYFKYFSQNNSVNGAQDGVLYARNTTNEDWTLVHSYTDALVPDQNTPYTFNVNSTNYYKIYALVLTRKTPANTGTGGVAVGELEYYGYEEGSGSLDTTLKSVYNVPATTGTQLEVYYDAKDLGDGAVTNVTDLSPNTNGGTGTDVTVADGAFVFNGTSSLMEKTSLSIPGSDNPFTISFWLKNDDFDNNQYILRLGINQTIYETVAIYKNSSNQIVFASWTLDFPIDYTFTSGQWNHISLIYPGGGWKQSNLIAYVDGKPYTFGGNLSVGGVGGTVLSLATSLTLRLGGFSAGNTHLDGSIANFRLYSKALNADQVKELYDYQKDYFLGSKSQVTLYKGHLGVGVTEPSGQLELAGDERIQEYPPRGMTDFDTYIEGHGVFTASATTYGATSATKVLYHPWKAFNKDRTDANGGDNAWLNGPDISGGDYNTSTGVYEGTEKHHGGAPNGAALQLSMPYEIYLKGYSLAPWNYAAGADFQYADSPSDFIIYGSKDNVNWEQIDSRTGQGMSSQADIKRFSLDTQDSYSHFAIVVTKNNTAAYPSTDASFVAIEEWRLFGTPGPTTLDKGSLSLTRSLDVPRISRYDVDTETPRPEKLVVDYDTTVNSSPTDISGQGNHGAFYNGAYYSAADKAFSFDGSNDSIRGIISNPAGDWVHSISFWFKLGIDQSAISGRIDPFSIGRQGTGGVNRTADLPSDDIIGHYSACDMTPTAINWYFFGNDASFSISGIKANEWHHLTFAYEGSGAVASRHAFLDGVEYPNVGTSTAPLAMFANSILALGVDFGRVSSSPAPFNGQLSNFKIYNAYLEPSEVKKLYKLGRTGRSMVISDTAVGIGKVPEAQLDVRGNLNVDGVVRPYTCAFSAYASSGGNSSATGVFPADGVHFDIGNCYDASTYEFTAPVYGIYYMSWSAYTNQAATTTSRIFAYQSNNMVEQKGHTIEKHGNSLSLTVRMQAGETFNFRGSATYPIYYYGANIHNRFSGHLICAL